MPGATSEWAWRRIDLCCKYVQGWHVPFPLYLAIKRGLAGFVLVYRLRDIDSRLNVSFDACDCEASALQQVSIRVPFQSVDIGLANLHSVEARF